MLNVPVRFWAERAQPCPRCSVLIEEGQFLHRVEVNGFGRFTCSDATLQSEIAAMDGGAIAASEARRHAERPVYAPPSQPRICLRCGGMVFRVAATSAGRCFGRCEQMHFGFGFAG